MTLNIPDPNEISSQLWNHMWLDHQYIEETPEHDGDAWYDDRGKWGHQDYIALIAGNGYMKQPLYTKDVRELMDTSHKLVHPMDMRIVPNGENDVTYDYHPTNTKILELVERLEEGTTDTYQVRPIGALRDVSINAPRIVLSGYEIALIGSPTSLHDDEFTTDNATEIVSEVLQDKYIPSPMNELDDNIIAFAWMGDGDQTRPQLME